MLFTNIQSTSEFKNFLKYYDRGSNTLKFWGLLPYDIRYFIYSQIKGPKKILIDISVLEKQLKDLKIELKTNFKNGNPTITIQNDIRILKDKISIASANNECY